MPRKVTVRGRWSFRRTATLTQDLAIPVKRRGYHELTVRVMQGRTELLRRETTFAAAAEGHAQASR